MAINLDVFFKLNSIKFDSAIALGLSVLTSPVTGSDFLATTRSNSNSNPSGDQLIFVSTWSGKTNSGFTANVCQSIASRVSLSEKYFPGWRLVNKQ